MKHELIRLIPGKKLGTDVHKKATGGAAKAHITKG